MMLLAAKWREFQAAGAEAPEAEEEAEEEDEEEEVSFRKMKEMVFCCQNCSDLLWEKIVLVREKIVLVREKLLNLRLKANNFQKLWDH